MLPDILQRGPACPDNKLRIHVHHLNPPPHPQLCLTSMFNPFITQKSFCVTRLWHPLPWYTFSETHDFHTDFVMVLRQSVNQCIRTTRMEQCSKLVDNRSSDAASIVIVSSWCDCPLRLPIRSVYGNISGSPCVPLLRLLLALPWVVFTSPGIVW